MARALVNKQAAVNITDSERAVEKDFSEQVPPITIGPEPVHSGSGEAISNPTPVISQINRWKVMTTGDEGLKTALYDWINTTKDGVKVTPNLVQGRSKKLTFNFQGNIGKSIAPGEIGEFNLIFSYSPQTISASSNVSEI